MFRNEKMGIVDIVWFFFSFLQACGNSQLKKFSRVRGKAQYANKVKCFTLQTAQSTSSTSRSRLMLGLKDPKDDSHCDYEPRAVVTKQKKVKSDIMPRGQAANMMLTARNNANNQANDLAIQEQNFKSHPDNIILQVQDLKEKEESMKDDNSINFFNPPEQNEENSKALIESIGSWINELFNVTNKSSLESESEKMETQKKSISEEDMEYFKSINTITEQFRKKLKNETTVHLSTSEKPFEFNFDKALDYGKKNIKKTKLLPASSPQKTEKELNFLDDKVLEIPDPLDWRLNENPMPPEVLIRTKDSATPSKPVNSKANIDADVSVSAKKKRKSRNRNRYEFGDSEEFGFSKLAELSKRTLLNINHENKRAQFYKNLGFQEAQHCGQGQNKAYQTSARCYTTNANQKKNSPIKTSGNLNSFSHYCSTDAAFVKGGSDILSRTSLDMKKAQTRKPSKKAMSDLTRESISFIKVKSPKSLTNLQLESGKNDTKTSSDDLVKYLMKKIKTNNRPQKYKKKVNVNTSPSLSNQKSRFLQSATNTLVMKVIAKNDGQPPTKSSSQSSSEPRLYPVKELVVKYPENGIRFDVSRAIHSHKSSKCSYLLEDDRVVQDSFLLDRNSYKNTRRAVEDILKRDDKKKIDKQSKRQEIKNMLDKLDVLQETKLRQPKKKPIQNLLENFDSVSLSKEAQNPRFQKQHELFKTTLKNGNQNPDSESNFGLEEKESKNSATSLDANLLPAELIVSDSDLVPCNTLERTEIRTEQPDQVAEPSIAKAFFKEPDNKIAHSLTFDEKSVNVKTEKKQLDKPTLGKDRLHKEKPTNCFYETDQKLYSSPLTEDYPVENPNQKDNFKTYESTSPSSVVRATKPSEVSLVSRKNSKNALNEMSSLFPWNYRSNKSTLYLCDSEKETEKEKETKGRKKTKAPKIIGSHEANIESSCGFEKVTKKPGPNCEKEDQN